MEAVIEHWWHYAEVWENLIYQPHRVKKDAQKRIVRVTCTHNHMVIFVNFGGNNAKEKAEELAPRW